MPRLRSALALFALILWASFTTPALARPSADEQALLGAFRYSRNRAVLHRDKTLMPRRKAAWVPPPVRYERGYGWMFSRHILQADQGCDFDFLETTFGAPVPEPAIF